MSRRFEHKRQEWAKQEDINDALAKMKRDDRRRKIIFFFIFIPSLFLMIAGMFWLAMIVPSLIMGI